MPVLELDINGTPTRVEVDDGFTPSDLDHIAKALSGGTAPPKDEGSPLERAGSYLLNRGKEVAGAWGRIAKHTLTPPPLRGTKTREVMAGVIPKGPGMLDAAGDLASAAQVLPGVRGLSAAGAAVGAGVRAAGRSEDTARMADAATGLVGGAAIGGFKAARGIAKAKDVVEEGQRLQTLSPGMRGAVAAERAKQFDPIIEGLTRSGRTLDPAGKDKLGKALLDAQGDWGMVAGGGEKRVIQSLLDRLTDPKGPGITAETLDEGLKVLNAGGKGFAARRALVNAMNDLAAGTPFAGKLSEAARAYHDVIRPAKAMADAVAKAKTPGQAAQAASRLWKNISPASQKLLDPSGEVAKLVGSVHQSQRGALAFAGGIGALGASALATKRFMDGDVAGGFQALLYGVPGLAVRYPGMAKAAAEGMAGGVGRGAAAAAGTMAPTAASPPEPAAAPTPTEPATAPEDDGSVGYPSPAPQDTAEAAPAPNTAPPEPQEPFARELATVSKVVGIDEKLLRAVIATESVGRPDAVSEKGAIGLMQFIPSTWLKYRGRVEALTGRPAKITDPLDSLIAGALYYKQNLADAGGDVRKAAILYHGGPSPKNWGPRTLQYGQDVADRYRQLSQPD